MTKPLREKVRARKIDPRAASNPQASEEGGVNLLKLLAREDRNPQTNELEAPRMIVLPAYSGKRIDDGVTHVNDLLDWKESEPYCPILNEPRLYVAAHCRQAIWMFENYTGRGGEEGGCKDVADLARYIAQDEDLRYLEPGGRLVTGGFKDGY